MSYICLFANEHGAAVAGDSRLTLMPMKAGITFDGGNKVFRCPELGLLWGCTGMTFFGGINYTAVAGHILRNPLWSLPHKLSAIGDAVSPGLALRHAVTRQEEVFSLLLAEVKPEGVRAFALDAVNGKVTISPRTGLVSIEAGWEFSLRRSLVPSPMKGTTTAEELAELAAKRVLQAVRLDQALRKAGHGHVQTVGGQIHAYGMVRKRTI